MNLSLLVVLITIKYSRYWPAAGGTNCATFVDGQCISRMASGYRWEDWVDRACACPEEWPFGTIIELDGQEWVCMDRGGKIKYVDGLPWGDFLTARSAYGYGELVEVKVTRPVSYNSGREAFLLELDVFALDNLRAGEVNSTDRKDEVHPSLEAYRDLFVAESSEQSVEVNADDDGEEEGGVAFDSRDRDREVLLDERLDLIEPLHDEGSLQDPVDEQDWKRILNQKNQDVLECSCY